MKDSSTRKARKRRQRALEGARWQSRGLLRVYLLKKSSVAAQKCCFPHYSPNVSVAATFAVNPVSQGLHRSTHCAPFMEILSSTLGLLCPRRLMSTNPSSNGICFGYRLAYRLQSTTIRCLFMQTIQPSHLNRRIRNRPLETARATPLRLSFQCIKESPVMTS